MRDRLDRVFREKRSKGESALIVYLAAGQVGLPPLAEMIGDFADAGADIIEIGIPFSDPMADGPVIQAASQRALEAGFLLERDFWPQIKEARAKNPDLPLLGMTYFNIVLHPGLKRFTSVAQKSGLDGLIIPDLPVEEASELSRFCREDDLYLIPLLAPTSTDERIAATIAVVEGGFIYCVSATGVTGVRTQASDEAERLVARVRKKTGLPLAIGFGIGTPERAQATAKVADGVIVGSAIVQLLLEGEAGYPKALALTTAMKDAMVFR